MFHRVVCLTTAALVVGLLTHPGVATAECIREFAPEAGIHCFHDYGHLTRHLRETRFQTVRTLQPRWGEAVPESRHNQYFNACFYFGLAPIVEYLGYSMWQYQSHFTLPMWYMTRTGIESHDLDVGYQGSPEDLISIYTTYDTIYRAWLGGEGADIYHCGFFDAECPVDCAQDSSPAGCTSCCTPASEPRTDLNTHAVDCSWGTASDYNIFGPGEGYGLCSFLSSTFDGFLQEVQNGCGGPCACSPDATCGMFWFMNQVLPSYERLAGATDAFNIHPETAWDRIYARRIIRAFVDNNVPLLVGVNNGGHFVTIVGWADMDSVNEAPRYAIATDPTRRVFWKLDLYHWGDNERFSPVSIYPWNQHLAGGCEPGGWAAALDAGLPADYQLCRPRPFGAHEYSVEPYYGIHLTCDKDGRGPIDFYAPSDDAFISVMDNIDCDRVTLRYLDGEREVTYARIRRYGFRDAEGRWVRFSTFAPSVLETRLVAGGRRGPDNVVEWDMAAGSWGNNYLLTAQGWPGSYSMRRSAIELRFADGERRWIEIGPPYSYGLEVTCQYGATETTYYEEADHATFWKGASDAHATIQFPEDVNRRCDRIEVKVNLGYGVPVSQAEIERQYYRDTTGEWRKANASAPWDPDTTTTVADGLTGSTKTFVWDAVWPDRWYASALSLGGAGANDRKTLIRLKDAAGTVLRTVEIVPY